MQTGSAKLRTKELRTSHVDFLKKDYSGNLSGKSAEVLILAIRKSSRRQYHTAWKAFTNFVRSYKPKVIEDKVVLSFMKFSPATVAMYKSALFKPLLWAF